VAAVRANEDASHAGSVDPTLGPQARQDYGVAAGRTAASPTLICFDGSADAAAAIVTAGEMLAPRAGVVLTVWEPVASWALSDPATILTSPLSRLASKQLDLDEISQGVSRELMQRGVELASKAGFEAKGRLEEGKPARKIREVADELGAQPIVLGARGLGRVESMLLGSVSIAVMFHAQRPVLVVPHHESQEPTAATEQ
jgi:nucleotide-binding universal stress UspA family protein